MDIKITDKILSLPPYISTCWKNVVSLCVESRPYGHVFLIELATGTKAEVPNLDPKVIEMVFATHARVVEQEGSKTSSILQTFAFPLPLEGMTAALQHNPEQADAPPLPPEILDKLKSLKDILPQDPAFFPKSEAHCNCPFCQILRAVTQEEANIPLPEETISDEDLKFRTWDIKMENEKLYSVSNPLDPKEHYNVFLGEPLGCTCGSKNCEHIQAVLRT